MPDATWPKSDPAGVHVVRPLDQYGRMTGVPIGVGESIALLRIGNSGSEPFTSLVGTGGTLAVGTDRPSEGTVSLGSVGASTLVQWVVEPDADADSYGDETQDKCVGTPGPCGLVQTGPDVITEVVKEVTVTQVVTKEVPVTQTVTVPTAACVSARAAATRAKNALKKAKAALKKRKSAASRKKAKGAQRTVQLRDAAVSLQC